MFMMPTSVNPGAALAVIPAFWSEEYAAVSYYPGGDIEILKLEGRKETADGIEYETARAVVKSGVGDAGCCANVIWYT
jgi:carboxy-cis,cis-muconate cyclase